MNKFFFILFLAAAIAQVNAQPAVCPPNIDFEYNNFTNWLCRSGTASFSGSGVNTITWTGTGEVFNRHTIIPSSDTSKDEYGNFPVSCPNGSGFSTKLGNPNAGAEAEGVFYTYNIPATVSQFIILYHYAVVFNDPPTVTQHAIEEKPRFQARIINVTDNVVIGCVSFDFFSSYSLPGFTVSPRSTITDTIIYKDWTPVSLDVGAFAGKTIRLEFITSDCTRGGHFGYAYVDVGSNCSSSVAGATICSGNNQLNLSAPYGYQSYTWYSDAGYTQVIGNGQSLILNPAPAVGSVLPVIVVPHPGYGCVDTFFANITTAISPLSVAGPDRILCQSAPVQLGAGPTPYYIYQWSPSWLVEGTTLSNPFTKTLASTTDFILKTTDLASGCFSYDTARVAVINIDTATTITGKLNYCTGEPITTQFRVTSQYSTLQWYNNTAAVPGAVNPVFSPSASGNYWARINDNGCVDSTRVIPFAVNARPQAVFTVNKNTQCITGNSFVFNNTSSIGDGTPLTWLWKFADGNFSNLINPVKNYIIAGNYPVQLLVKSVHDCRDSSTKPVTVMPNAKPDFNWNSFCLGRPVNFNNLTNENGSLSLNYLWDFGNGQTSVLKIPPPIIYDSSRKYNIQLQTISPGCELFPQTITKSAEAHAPRPNIKYNDITIPVGYSIRIFARDISGISYNWQPALQLNDNTIKAPLFYAGNDVKYTIEIKDKYTCVTTDTLQVWILKKNGYYLPTAFTPNNDGLNDVIRSYLVGMKGLKRFSIYNRSGTLLYSTSRDGEGWDGNFKGVAQPIGVYVWLLEYITGENQTVIQKGTLTLIR